MLDRDLAEIYGVETRVLNQSIKRNIERFPEDFMFQLTDNELLNWKSQIVITNSINMGLRQRPYAFTELGVAMLSSILNSKTALQINISIMRAFVALRHYSIKYTELKKQLDDFMLESNIQFNDIYQALTELTEQKQLEETTHREIGFMID
jgi:hypothetical protein